MRIDSKLFALHHTGNNITKWECPYCNKGILKKSKDETQFKIEESAESLRHHSDEEWEPEFCSGIFRGKLVCNNPSCGENVFFSGTASVEFAGYVEIDGHNEGAPNFEWYIQPQYFTKPINLFKLEDYYPEKVRSCVQSAFGLFWMDEASCANKIRTAVESVLNLKRIPRVRANGSFIFLHERIMTFKKKSSAAAHFFLAIKFIGNSGSHADDEKLERSDLIAAFEFLKQGLEIIYNPHTKEIKKLASQVIKAKAPLSKIPIPAVKAAVKRRRP